MPEATITCPEKLSFPQVAGMLYQLEGVALMPGTHFEYAYSAESRQRYNAEVMIDTLRDAGFEPAQIREIRFMPHEVTADMYEWRDGRPYMRDDREPSMLTAHIPVEYPGREGLHGHFHTTRQP